MVNSGARVKNCVGPGEPQHIVTTRPLPSLYAASAVFWYSRANDDANDGRGVRFAKPDKGDWSPRAKSPLRDAGVLCDWMADARDFLGKRPRDFGGGPDVGCFEHYGEPPTILVLR